MIRAKLRGMKIHKLVSRYRKVSWLIRTTKNPSYRRKLKKEKYRLDLFVERIDIKGTL
jgi:hypothetical protein